jgi:predicted enzyme related to lactoylglutathione lyase
MAIIGTHTLIYTSEPEALRAVLRDVFGFSHVDDGDGWLIFKLPPAEMGVHPAEGDNHHAISFMCDDIEATMTELTAQGIDFTEPVTDQGYGLVTVARLPGDVSVQIYQPRHTLAI